MRLFVAVRLDEACTDALCDAIAALRGHARQGNFTRRENLHLTLAFLGETARPGLAKQAVGAVRASGFTLEFTGLGRFRRSGGDIWWMGCAESAALAALHAQVQSKLASAGFSLENRPFRPHLTLGREVLLEPGSEPLLLARAFPPTQMMVTEIALMESRRSNGALQYAPRSVQPLSD